MKCPVKGTILLIGLSVLVVSVLLGGTNNKARKATVAVYHQILFPWSEGEKGKGEILFVGSGVFVAPNLVLTASHNRPIPYPDEKNPYEREWWEKSVIRMLVKPFGSDRHYLTTPVFVPYNEDVMLLRVLGYRSTHYLPLGEPKEQMVCYLPTYYDGIPVEFTVRIQKVGYEVEWGVETMEKGKKLILFSPNVYPGVSGSPLVHKDKIVGIVVGRFSPTYPFGLAYPIDVIRQFLKN